MRSNQNPLTCMFLYIRKSLIFSWSVSSDVKILLHLLGLIKFALQVSELMHRVKKKTTITLFLQVVLDARRNCVFNTRLPVVICIESITNIFTNHGSMKLLYCLLDHKLRITCVEKQHRKKNSSFSLINCVRILACFSSFLEVLGAENSLNTSP